MDFSKEFIVANYTHDNTDGSICKIKTGKKVIAKDTDGYVVVSATIAPRTYKKMRGARLVWVLYHGDIPEGMIVDHINRIRDDNRIENLRLASCKENAVNSNRNNQEDYTSVYKGVQKDKHSRWKASIQTNGVTKQLGLFLSEEAAAHAYNIAAVEIHGEFAYVNDVPIVCLDDFLDKRTLKDFVEKRTGLPMYLVKLGGNFVFRTDDNVHKGVFKKAHLDDAILFANHYHEQGKFLDLKTNMAVYNKFGLPLNIFPCSTGFRASFVHNYKRTHVGTFKTVEEAVVALEKRKSEVINQ